MRSPSFLNTPELGAFSAWFESWSGRHPEIARCAWTLRPSESSDDDGPDEEALAHVRRALIGVLRRRDLADTVRALRDRGD